MIELRKTMRERMVEFLHKALDEAIASYELFRDALDQLDDSGLFKTHHESCKMAIAHIQHLLKLANKMEVPESADTETTDAALAEMIERAKAEVEAYNRKKGQ